MPDDVLEKIITASGTMISIFFVLVVPLNLTTNSTTTRTDLSIHVLRVAGVDAGYFELEW